MNLRDNNIKRLANNSFDVLIIGAGINGAVAATALAARGAKAVSYTHLTLPTTPYV